MSPRLNFRRLVCHIHSIVLHFHSCHKRRNVRPVAGRGIIDCSVRHPCWLPWSKIGSAVLGGPRWRWETAMTLLAAPKSHICTPMPLLNSSGQRSRTSQSWWVFGQRWRRLRGKGQIRRACDKVCELSRIDPLLAELKPTLHLGWLSGSSVVCSFLVFLHPSIPFTQFIFLLHYTFSIFHPSFHIFSVYLILSSSDSHLDTNISWLSFLLFSWNSLNFIFYTRLIGVCL